MVHTYRQMNGHFEVGLFTPSTRSPSEGARWLCVKQFSGPSAELEAAAYASYLNGGEYITYPNGADRA